MEIHEYLLPNEAARPRRVAITPDDMLYYSDYGRGYLGEFDTKTGKIGEGMAIAERPAIAAVRNHDCERHRLVQRIRREAEYAGALRSEDRKIPDLDDSRAAAAWCAT